MPTQAAKKKRTTQVVSAKKTTPVKKTAQKTTASKKKAVKKTSAHLPSSSEVVLAIEQQFEHALVTTGEQIIAHTLSCNRRVEKLEKLAASGEKRHQAAKAKRAAFKQKVASKRTPAALAQLARAKEAYEQSSELLAEHHAEWVHAKAELKEMLAVQKKFTGLVKAITTFAEQAAAEEKKALKQKSVKKAASVKKTSAKIKAHKKHQQLGGLLEEGVQWPLEPLNDEENLLGEIHADELEQADAERDVDGDDSAYDSPELPLSHSAD